MRYLVTGSQMKEIDRYTIETVGIPSMVLMERAAMAVAEAAEEAADRKDVIWSVCGTGNNGADGIAAARMLFLKGYRVSVLLCGDPEQGTAEYRQQLDIAGRLEMPVIEFHDFLPGACDIIIDAVFGVGLCREIEGEYAEVLEFLQGRNAREIIAVDIPSGIHSGSGQVMGTALKATKTVTFGYEKIGTVLYPGKEYGGQVIVKDIGFPEVSFERAGAGIFTYGPEDLERLPKRPAYSHKGRYGKVLVAAGSGNMSGAAYLSALAAYRTGAGLVKLFTVEANRGILQGQLPEAVIETYDSAAAEEGKAAFRKQIEASCEWADVIVLGPGIGQEPYAKQLVREILEHAYVPVIIDADGLNAIASDPGLTQYYTENIIITPHLAEMARLTGKTAGEIRENLIGTAAEYSGEYGITCILKDAVTVVAGREGQIYLNTSGCSAMAKAGAGDVLTGVVAGLLAQGKENWDGAVLGAFLHGMAGSRCAGNTNGHGLLAREIADEVAAL